MAVGGQETQGGTEPMELGINKDGRRKDLSGNTMQNAQGKGIVTVILTKYGNLL